MRTGLLRVATDPDSLDHTYALMLQSGALCQGHQVLWRIGIHYGLLFRTDANALEVTDLVTRESSSRRSGGFGPHRVPAWASDSLLDHPPMLRRRRKRARRCIAIAAMWLGIASNAARLSR